MLLLHRKYRLEGGEWTDGKKERRKKERKKRKERLIGMNGWMDGE